MQSQAAHGDGIGFPPSAHFFLSISPQTTSLNPSFLALRKKLALLDRGVAGAPEPRCQGRSHSAGKEPCTDKSTISVPLTLLHHCSTPPWCWHTSASITKSQLKEGSPLHHLHSRVALGGTSKRTIKGFNLGKLLPLKYVKMPSWAVQATLMQDTFWHKVFPTFFSPGFRSIAAWGMINS